LTKRRISHYEIEKALGEGAMGQVFLARDVNLDRPVALKMVHGALGDKGFQDRFRREARLAAQLNHPHIATIYEFGEEKGESYIAMELVEGETLADRLNHGPLSPAEVRRLGAQTASALDAAHARGIVHRDIKPANLMITPAGDIKVMDFGVARRSGDTQLTMDGALVGTANIMAPETIEGGEATPASDLFSLGCVLYEALTGRPAFPGESLVTVLHQVMSRDAQPLTELAPGVPNDLVDLVHGLLVKDPARRLGPAEAVARALTEATGTASGFSAGTMVLPPAGGTMVMPGAGTAAGVGAGLGTGGGVSAAGVAGATATGGTGDPGGGVAGATTTAGTTTPPEPATGPRKARWRRPVVWAPLAVIAVGFLIWIGMNLENEGVAGADRVRAETLNVLGMEKLGILTNQLGPKDRDLAAETRKLFRDAIQIDTTYAVPHNNLGRLAMLLGDRSGARREYETALVLDREYATAYLNMAAWLESEDRSEEAEFYYRSAIQYDDSDSLTTMKTAANNLSYFYLAHMGQPDSALVVLEPVVERFPRVSALSKNYGLALLAKGRVDEAEIALRRALDFAGGKFAAASAGLAAAAEARGDSAAAAEKWADVRTLLGAEEANQLRRAILGITGVDSEAVRE